MIRNSLFVLVVLAGCSYNTTNAKNTTDHNNKVESVGEEGVEHVGEATTESDAGADDVEEIEAAADDEYVCSFEISEGFDNYETTVTNMTYRLNGPSEIEIYQGDTVNFSFTTSADNCGASLLNGMLIVVSSDEIADWVTSVDNSEEEMRLVHTTGSSQIDGLQGTNCNSDGSDRQVFYEWDHTPNTPSADAYMDEVFVAAGEAEQFSFYFTQTTEIPVGTVFEIYMLDPSWIDLESGADVWDSYYYGRQGDWDTGLVVLTVTVVE